MNPGLQSTEEHGREIRLGLVMYGGISLAIYIYGVARSFFDAQRGRGVFGLLKTMTDSDIAVDVISGTSAGGINGILLAYCMTNELEFGEAASTWREQGGIQELLRDPSQDMTPPSVLRGDGYFLPQLVATFNRLIKHPAAQTSVPGGESPSPLPELDLFVTGTDVHGRVETRFDALGHPIDVKDHRVVFHLKHREGRKEVFHPQKDPAVCEALGTLARITSSFPAAFEPVEIPANHTTQLAPPHDRLALWGWGPTRTPRNVFLVDGGVLDNKPFSITVREIFHRLSERPVQRKLFYVEPDPERFPRPKHVDQPRLWKVIWDSLSSIPGYESIAADLDEIDSHNERVSRFNKVVDRYRERTIALDPESRAFVDRVREWEAGKNAPVEALVDADASEVPSPYAKCRLGAMAGRVVTGILRVDGHGTKLSESDRHSATVLMNAFDHWPGSGDYTLYNFDVEFRLRRLFHTLYTCPCPASNASPEENRARWCARYALNRQIKLLEIVHNAMQRLLDEGKFRWQPHGDAEKVVERYAERVRAGSRDDAPTTASVLAEGATSIAAWAERLWRDEIAAAFLFLLNDHDGVLCPWLHQPVTGIFDGGWLTQEALSAFNTAMLERLERTKEALAKGEISTRRPAPEQFTSILVTTDAAERRFLRRFGDISTQYLADGGKCAVPLYAEYKCYIELDAQLCPMLEVCAVGERDVIETVRISPLDAQRGFCAAASDAKVSGDAVHHFGGFFKESWRANDILWGRLDSVCQLVETLLTPDNVDSALRDATVAERVRGVNVATLFPHAPAATVTLLQDWLADLAAKNAAASSPSRFEAMRDLLIEAQQLEILHDEVPTVVESAIAEQMRWNQLRVLPPSGAPLPGFDPEHDGFFAPATGARDALVSAAAAGELARQAVGRITAATPAVPPTDPKSTPLGDFFRRKYRVGAESLTKDVPLAVLLDLASTALLVARNCVVATFDDPAAVRKTALYRIISILLWVFDGMVSLLKRGSAYVVAAMAVIFLLATLAFAVGVYWWGAIISTSEGLNWRWLLCFIVLPLALVAGQLWFLQQLALRRRLSGADPIVTRNPLAIVPPRWGTWAVVTLLAATAGVFFIQGQAMGWELGRVTQLLEDPTQVAVLTPEQRSQLWTLLQWDSIGVALWASALSLAALQVARRLHRAGSILWPVGVAIAWIAFAAAAVDLIENATLAWLLGQEAATGLLGSVRDVTVSFGRQCSHFKWTLPVAVVTSLVAGYGYARLRMR